MTDPAPTTGSPRRNRRMKRRNKLGGPEVEVELLDFKKEEPSI